MSRTFVRFLYILSIGFSWPFVNLIANDWSTPEIISPQTSILNANTPFLSTDGQGNSIVVWYEGPGIISNIGSMYAARSSQHGWVLTDPIAANDVKMPFNSKAQAIGMDVDGNSLAVWADSNNNIRAAALASNESCWISFQEPLNYSSNAVGNPYISVAPNGNAVVLWTEQLGFSTYRLLAKVYDAEMKQWKEEQDVFNAIIENAPLVNQVEIDSRGNALAVLSIATDTIKAARLNFETNSWSQINPIPFSPLKGNASLSISVDKNGNGAIVWVFNENTAYAATLPNNQINFSNPTLLSSNVNNLMSPPVVKTDSYGNALAVWSENRMGVGLGSARYSITKGTWQALPPLELDGKTPANISLSVNAQGNAVAAWMIYYLGKSDLQIAILPACGSRWQLLPQLISENNLNHNLQVILTSQGNVVAVWEKNTREYLSSSINCSYLLKPFPPTSPSQQEPSPDSPLPPKNAILKKNTRDGKRPSIFILIWTPSPSRNVVKYHLYRNKLLIAQIPNRLPYIYWHIDKNHIISPQDYYEMTAVDESGLESSPASITQN